MSIKHTVCLHMHSPWRHSSESLGAPHTDTDVNTKTDGRVDTEDRITGTFRDRPSSSTGHLTPDTVHPPSCYQLPLLYRAEWRTQTLRYFWLSIEDELLRAAFHYRLFCSSFAFWVLLLFCAHQKQNSILLSLCFDFLCSFCVYWFCWTIAQGTPNPLPPSIPSVLWDVKEKVEGFKYLIYMSIISKLIIKIIKLLKKKKKKRKQVSCSPWWVKRVTKKEMGHC